MDKLQPALITGMRTDSHLKSLCTVEYTYKTFDTPINPSIYPKTRISIPHHPSNKFIAGSNLKLNLTDQITIIHQKPAPTDDPHKHCQAGGGDAFHCGCKYNT
jgi:hypothetical protein